MLSTSRYAVARCERSPCLALVFGVLCAGVGMVAVGSLADRLIALDERAERSGDRGDRRRQPAELQIVDQGRCVPDVAVIDGRRDEGSASHDTEDKQARI